MVRPALATLSHTQRSLLFWLQLTLVAFLAAGLPCTEALAQDYTGPHTIAYTHQLEAFPAKRLHFSVDDSLLFYNPGSGKYTELAMPSSAGIEAMFTLQRSYTKAFKKLTAEDLLFLTHALLTWDTLRMTIGFTFTTSGLGYKITEQGSGKNPEVGKRVYVHYRGYLEDGTEFDNSFNRGEPIAFQLGVGQVIKGWDEGIQLFPVGSKGTLRIPAELGYGARGAGGIIPPNATLLFDIEVVKAD